MQSVISFIMANQALLAGLGVAILDLVFSLKKDWAANSILHWVYLQLQTMKNKVLPPSQ